MSNEQHTVQASIDAYLLFLYALAAVTGGAAGCALAAVFKLRGVNITRYVVLAYIAVAGFAGLIFTAFYIAHGWIRPSIADVVIYGGSSAAIIGAVLSGVNVTIRLSSRRFTADVLERFGTTITVEPESSEPLTQEDSKHGSVRDQQP